MCMHGIGFSCGLGSKHQNNGIKSFVDDPNLGRNDRKQRLTLAELAGSY